MVSGYLLFGRNEVTPAYVCRKVYSIIRYIVSICLIYWAIVAISHNNTTFWPGCIEEVFRTMVLRGAIYSILVLMVYDHYICLTACIISIIPTSHKRLSPHVPVVSD